MNNLLNIDSNKSNPCLTNSHVKDLIINTLEQKIGSVRQKWLSALQGSIQLWIKFINVKIQCFFKQIDSSDNIQDKLNTLQIEKELKDLIIQTQQSVLKGLKNIQRLYLIPQLTHKTNSQSKQLQINNNLNLQRGRSISNKKHRSSSATSDQNKKTTLFRRIQLNNTENVSSKDSTLVGERFTKTQNEYEKTKISKFYKPKPKFDNSCQFGLSTNMDRQNNKISTQLSKSVSDYFTQKQNRKQMQIIQKISNKLQQKIKAIQTNFNTKLNTIQNTIKNIPNQKITTNRNKVIQPQNKQKIQKNQNTNLNINLQALPLQKKQNIKRNSMSKRITSNPIVQQNSYFENIQLTKLHNVDQSIYKDFEDIQANLNDFMEIKKKVKLPINEQLINIFMNSYMSMASSLKANPKLQKLGFPSNFVFQQIQQNKAKNELKQCFLKLKKLLSMDSLSSKAQKIKAYIDRSLRCSYDLLLKQKYQIKQNTSTQLEIIICKL